MRVFLKMTKRSNRKDDCETKILLRSKQREPSLPFNLDSEHICTSVDVLSSEAVLYLLPTEAENVEPFMRGVTIPDRPVRVQFVDRR